MGKETDHIIIGVHITNRLKRAEDVQKVLTHYGCNIKTRLGLHETSPDYCAPNGILLIETTGDPKLCHELADKLAGVEGVEVQRMVFKHS